MSSLRILAISGSLRAASLNSALLRVAAQVAPSGIAVSPITDIGNLPLFNPDLDRNFPPAAESLRRQIVEANAVLIASPEYAHGISGVLKNALDWMVTTEAFVNKPVALLNASPRATHAQVALREVLTMMSAHIVDEASITLPVLGNHSNEAAILADRAIVDALKQALSDLARIEPAPLPMEISNPQT